MNPTEAAASRVLLEDSADRSARVGEADDVGVVLYAHVGGEQLAKALRDALR